MVYIADTFSTLAEKHKVWGPFILEKFNDDFRCIWREEKRINTSWVLPEVWKSMHTWLAVEKLLSVLWGINDFNSYKYTNFIGKNVLINMLGIKSSSRQCEKINYYLFNTYFVLHTMLLYLSKTHQLLVLVLSKNGWSKEIK